MIPLCLLSQTDVRSIQIFSACGSVVAKRYETNIEEVPQ